MAPQYHVVVHLIPFIRQVLALTKPYRMRFILGLICGMLAGVASPLLMGSVKLVVDTVFAEPGAPSPVQKLQKAPPIIQGLVQHILPSVETWHVQSSTALTLLVIATVPLAMLLRGLFTYLNVYLMNWVSIRAINDLRARLFNHLMGLSSSFFSDTSTGSLMAHLNAASSLQSMIGNSMVVIVREPITIVSLLCLLVYQQPKLSLIALVIFPLTLIPFVIYARKVRGSSRALQRQVTEQSKLIHESLTGYRIVKAYNLEATIQREFVKTSQASISHTMRVLRAQEIPGPLIEFFGSVGVAAFFAYIALPPRIPITTGGLLQFVLCIFMLYQPIKSLIRLHSTVEQAQAATEYMFRVLATKSVIEEPAHPKPLHAAGKDIVFDRLTFSYGEKAVLHDVSFQVKAGLMVALVGSSGSGKTTLTNLLLRFYDPQHGSIRIGDTGLREVATSDLRGQIAVVTQETILFNDTILRNIELGRPGATKEEIITAAKHAYAHDFIMEKPLGYETLAGEKGVNMSGGQRQRLAIARAILKNAPILILDEATSSLDTESERIVQKALETLMEGRTTICIAHRLSTVQRADLIVVLDKGRIVETGTHAELLRAGRVYTKLYELQFEQPTA
jgi:subfamily B ATP-binding cassette protein MsbA